MEFTQENFDKVIQELANLKSEAENKGGALVEKNRKMKELSEKLAEFEAKEKENAQKLQDDREKELIKKGEEKKLLEQYKQELETHKAQLDEYKPYKEKVELIEKQSLEQKTSKYAELSERLKDVIPQKQNILDAFGDNLDAKIAYLEDISISSGAGFSGAPAKPGKPAESVGKFEEAKAKGDVKSMIANAPIIGTV